MKPKPEPKAHKPQTPIRTHAMPAARFDPRWCKAQTCKKECERAAPCDHPIHGGYKMGVLASQGAQPDWPTKLRTAVCTLCECQAGQQMCIGCLCHGDEEAVKGEGAEGSTAGKSGAGVLEMPPAALAPSLKA